MNPPAKPMLSTKTIELMRTYKRIGMSEELFSKWARDVEIKDCKTSDSEEVEQCIENWLEMFRRSKFEKKKKGERNRKVIGRGGGRKNMAENLPSSCIFFIMPSLRTTAVLRGEYNGMAEQEYI
jgi:hypothetical protein